jgi:hypothetical protein
MSTALTQEQKIVHFLNRTSFGPTREELAAVKQLGISAYLDQQLSLEQIADSFVADKIAELKTMRLSSRELLELYPQPAAAQAKGMEMTQMQGPRQVILERIAGCLPPMIATPSGPMLLGNFGIF